MQKTNKQKKVTLQDQVQNPHTNAKLFQSLVNPFSTKRPYESTMLMADLLLGSNMQKCFMVYFIQLIS